MIHADFVSSYRSGKLAAHIDQSLAMQLMSSPLIPANYRAAHHFYTWLWLLCFPAAICCFVWVNWWAGALLLLVGFAMPSAIRKAAASSVMDCVIESPALYDLARTLEVLTLSPR